MIVHSPYEPTPYCVLDRMLDNGVFDEVSYLIDFGCGKGRVSFYLAYRCGIRTLGIEKESVFRNYPAQGDPQHYRLIL